MQPNFVLSCSVLIFCVCKLECSSSQGQGKLVAVPLLETASWIFSSPEPKSCIEKPHFDTCTDPWGVSEALWYAVGNVFAASLYVTEDLANASISKMLYNTTKKTASALGRFFRNPEQDFFDKVARRARKMHKHLATVFGYKKSWPKLHIYISDVVGLGVPFPITSVLVDPASATLQLRGGSPMPLLALAPSHRGRPSISGIADALRMGVRHIEIYPGIAESVGKAIITSAVPRSEIFLSVVWELPLDSESRFEILLRELGSSGVDLVMLPRVPDVANVWRLLKNLKQRGLVKALGVRDFSAEELSKYSGIMDDSLEYAQCKYSPYRPGPSRHTWQLFGQRSVSLAATSLISDWPHVLSPLEDPHLKWIAERVKRTVPQILIRWALQLGLAVSFHSTSQTHVAENLAATEFSLADADMRLISGLATLAQPFSPPGDGFAHIYTHHLDMKAVSEEL